MRRAWQAAVWAGGMLGATVTGSILGMATYRGRAAAPADAGTYPLDRPRAMRESTVFADDGFPLSTWELTESGTENPECTVVFVHGFALDSRAWHFQIRDLHGASASARRLVTFDQRGHGRSGGPAPNGNAIDVLAADLDAVLRTAVPTGPVVLVGHSMGGMVLMALAERCPELFTARVRAVALLGTSAGGLRDATAVRPWLSRYNPVPRGLGLLAGVQPELVERVRRLGDGVARRVTRARAFGRNSVPTAVVNLVVDMIGGTRVGVIADFLPAFAAHERTSALAGLNACAVLVLSGDADRITPFRHAEVIAAALPHSRLVRVEGAGHSIMLERPELVNDELAALLRSASPDADRAHEQRGPQS